MFASIANRYDFLNHFLSANTDRRWRRICAREVGKYLSRPCPRVLDVGCGTADLALGFANLGPVVGCDFCHPMLKIGVAKTLLAAPFYPVSLLAGDALALPFSDASFDAVVSAFVLRNLVDIPGGLVEMRRVLRPGGVLGILDFGLPAAPLWGRLYRIYFTRILPGLGQLISGVKGPYRYLPESVQTFPPPQTIQDLIKRAGFDEAEHRLLTAGIAILFLGKVRN